VHQLFLKPLSTGISDKKDAYRNKSWFRVPLRQRRNSSIARRGEEIVRLKSRALKVRFIPVIAHQENLAARYSSPWAALSALANDR
jgi:hypothetical protein